MLSSQVIQTTIDDLKNITKVDFTVVDVVGKVIATTAQMVIEKEVPEEFQRKLKGRLSSLEGQVLSLYLDGNNYIQIAEILEKSPKSVDNTLQRIRQKIRRLQQEK